MKPGRNLIYPLNEFYERSGLPLPVVLQVEGQDVPEPYRTLLVHENDMTPTLEGAYRRSIQVRVLEYELAGNVFSRQVVLVPEGATAPVAFGAIKIDLEHFPPAARRLVVERKQPLGAILLTQGVEHASHPDAYFQITSDAVIHSALNLASPCRLYGRRNVIVDGARRTLAEVVEVLPPVNGNLHLERNGAHR